jgi:hypothetical protein
MITLRITTDVNDDRRIILTLPPEVPTGQVELVVSVEARAAENQQPKPSRADLAEAQAGRDEKELSRYPLRGSVVRYERPTEAVAEADWEALG